ncbi:glycosyltransferase family 4 protein [Vibrio chagasii]|nr:glycosyltransferase family 4 protein [Vibrio chagasii]
MVLKGKRSIEKSKPNNLTFHRYQTKKGPCMETIDVLVIPSRYEGLPMAAQKPWPRHTGYSDQRW